MSDDLRLLLAMRHASGARSALARALIAHRDVRTVHEHGSWKLQAHNWQAAEQQIAALRSTGISVHAIHTLPALFWRDAAPPVLFVRGNAELLEQRGVAIVGSREAAADAERWAYDRAAEAVGAGELIVSGGAIGIDGAAHRAAVDARQPTLVYLGVACDEIYPVDHQRLFERVLAHGGALVSEHPPGTSIPRGAGHAARNRLIAAHPKHVLIAEAAAASGTLQTAKWAARLGIPVWVSPPGIGVNRDGLNGLLLAGQARVWDPNGP